MSAAFSISVIRWPIQPASRSTSRQDQPAGGFPEIAGEVLFGKDAPQDLVRAPAHGRDGGDAEPLIDLRAAGIVDPGHDVRDVERLAGHAGGQDVGVVAAGDRREGVRLGDAGLLEGVPVEARRR